MNSARLQAHYASLPIPQLMKVIQSTQIGDDERFIALQALRQLLNGNIISKNSLILTNQVAK